ncbi:MAG: hypothetical protein QM534_01345 [Sediminibacterium sp.]|nr:hypothetical protein [Sediminibacterium sp.]
MEKIAIICFTDYTREPRVLRTIAALQTQYHISVFSNGERIEGVNASTDVLAMNQDVLDRPLSFPFIQKLRSAFHKYVKGYKPGTQLHYERQYWSKERKSLLTLLEQGKFKVHIGHGIFTLPLLGKLASTSKVVFNAHEYYPEEFPENQSWRAYTKPYYEWILKTYLNKTHLTFSVTPSISQRYINEYGIKSVEVNNAGSFSNLTPTNNTGKIKLIHHGAALKGRRIEDMCELMTFLPDNYELNLMLVKSDENYFNELYSKYSKHLQINFIDPVPFSQIPKFINQFDIGLYIFKPNNFNEEFCLPNKFFEFIQARLCIAVTPNIEMKKIVSEYNLGVVSSDYTIESMSKAILSLDRAKIYEFKLNVNVQAYKLSSEQNSEKIVYQIESLLA